MHGTQQLSKNRPEFNNMIIKLPKMLTYYYQRDQ